MTREELKNKIHDIIISKYSNVSPDYPPDDRVEKIMKLVDNYTVGIRVGMDMIPTSRFSIHSDNNCKCPACPYCGSVKYTIVSHSNGNHRCDTCGRVYFFNYNQSV